MMAWIKQYKNPLFIATSVVLTSLAQIFMKMGMMDLQQHLSVASLADITPAILLPVVLWVAAGLLFYVISMVSWMAALRAYDLSLAYPLLSLSYVLVYLLALYIPAMSDSYSHIKTLGLLLIIAGVVLVSDTAPARK